MTSNELEIRTETEIRLQEFEKKTGLPARASLSELEVIGGRYMSSKPVKIGGVSKSIEYVILDLTGAEQEVIIYRRDSNQEDFRVHIEMQTKNKY